MASRLGALRSPTPLPNRRILIISWRWQKNGSEGASSKPFQVTNKWLWGPIHTEYTILDHPLPQRTRPFRRVSLKRKTSSAKSPSARPGSPPFLASACPQSFNSSANTSDSLRDSAEPGSTRRPIQRSEAPRLLRKRSFELLQCLRWLFHLQQHLA
jgi:hypothetical protein